MPITLDRRPKGRYPFGIFHISMGSTLCTEFELKSDWTVGDLPSSVGHRPEILVGTVLYLSSIVICQQIFYRKNGKDQNSGIAYQIAPFKSYKTVYFLKSKKYGH